MSSFIRFGRPLALRLTACTLAVSGTLPRYDPGVAYSETLTISNAVGDCAVEVLSSTLPDGSVVYVDNSTDTVVIEIPAYGGATVDIDVDNPGFETGDTGWIKGYGIARANDEAYAGTWSMKHTARGESEIVADKLVPVTLAQSITATFQFRQGASKANNVTGTTFLDWYDANEVKLSRSSGNTVSSGSGGAWNPSTVTAAAPATGYVRPGFLFNRIRENKASWVDAFSWNGAYSETPPALPDSFSLSIRVRDQKGCVAEWTGTISVSDINIEWNTATDVLAGSGANDGTTLSIVSPINGSNSARARSVSALSGLVYFEIEVEREASGGNGSHSFGVEVPSLVSDPPVQALYSYIEVLQGRVFWDVGSSVTADATYTAGGVGLVARYGVAVDVPNRLVYFRRNNSVSDWVTESSLGGEPGVGSGFPIAGTGDIYAAAAIGSAVTSDPDRAVRLITNTGDLQWAPPAGYSTP